jgi:hypothetical protein
MTETERLKAVRDAAVAAWYAAAGVAWAQHTTPTPPPQSARKSKPMTDIETLRAAYIAADAAYIAAFVAADAANKAYNAALRDAYAARDAVEVAANADRDAAIAAFIAAIAAQEKENDQ